MTGRVPMTARWRPFALATLVALAPAGQACHQPPSTRAAITPSRQPPPSELIFSHATHAEQDISCVTCHKGVAEAAGLELAHAPTKAVCRECHEDELNDRSKCTMCHSDLTRAHNFPRHKTSADTQHLIFSHTAHLKRLKDSDGKDCVMCHAGAAVAKTLDQIGRPKMGPNCLSACHNHQEDYRALRCTRCHENLSIYPIKFVSAFNHEGNFLQEHARWARAQADVCASCHQQQYCADCHSQRAAVIPSIKFPEAASRGFIHRGDWLARHPIAARSEPQNCTRCHSTTQCAACHRARGVAAGLQSVGSGSSPHPPDWMDPSSPNNHGLEARRHVVDVRELSRPRAQDKLHLLSPECGSGGQRHRSASAGLAPRPTDERPDVQVVSLMRGQAIIGLLLASPLVLSGCYESRPALEARAPGCVGCHGTANNPAPPPGLWLHGSPVDAANPGVGAHQIHLSGSALAAPIPCGTCHVVPQTVDAPGHLDDRLPADVTFSGLATARDSAAAWDSANSTCTVYCHNSRFPGGTNLHPVWTSVGLGQADCGTCHGLPPGGTHPADPACVHCHSRVVDAQRNIIAPTLHVNGTVELDSGAAGACNGCHGGADNDAPPKDTQSDTSETTRGVGLHQAHVRASALHAPYSCATCHNVPQTVDAPGHLDTSLPAEVVFGDLPRGNLRTPPAALTPSYDANALTCTGSACHRLNGGASATWVWNQPQRLICGSCHGLPPGQTLSGAAHPASSLAGCAGCHSKVVDAQGQIVAPARHANGVVDLN